MIEVVAFAGALADASEHRVTTVRFGHVIDQFHDQHGLADAGATKQADFATLGIWREQIDDLDARHENRGLGGLVGVSRRFLMDGAQRIALDRSGFIDRVANHVDDAAQQSRTDRHGNRRAGIGDFLSAHQTFRGVHRDGANCRLAEMLSNLEHQPVALVFGFQRVEDRRQMIFELHVDNGADDLGDFSN